MEKTCKQMILNCEKLERRFAMLNGGRLEEYQIERDDSGPKVGNIYLGRIINLEPSLQAAFIDIGAEKNAFLHYHEMLPGGDELLEKQINEEDAAEEAARNGSGDAPIAARRKKRQEGKPGSKAISEALRRKKKLTVADIPEFFKPGMELLVQVVKSPIGTKGARVTTNMSIPGRYLVLMPYSEHIGLSTRIEGGQERDRLRKILASLELPEGMGLICRTVGEGRKATFFKRDLELLLDYWRKIETAMETKKAPFEVFAEPNLVERTIRDFMTEEIGGIVVDDKAACKQITDTLKRIGGAKMAEKVTFYNSPKPIFDHYRINDQLREVYQREVRLPGGGCICIDETEALIAIDVNSGRGRKGTDQPEFILKTNLEAAAEIARQLRLRNIGLGFQSPKVYQERSSGRQGPRRGPADHEETREGRPGQNQGAADLEARTHGDDPAARTREHPRSGLQSVSVLLRNRSGQVPGHDERRDPAEAEFGPARQAVQGCPGAGHHASGRAGPAAQ